MGQSVYNWVPDELVESADKIAEWLRHRGYKVKIETADPGFPYPPTLLATRGKFERIIVEILPAWQEERMNTWIAYAKSCQRELKVCVGIGPGTTLAQTALDRARRCGIGIIRDAGAEVEQQVEPADAAMSVSIPPRKSLHAESKTLLGPAYDHFESSRWREGFEEACKALERSAKKYLKKWIKTGRLSFVSRRGPVIYSDKRINKFTMGELENAFSQVQAQNSSDRTIYRALKMIRIDRNKLTHDKWNVATEKRLRANVSQHMWVITQALDETRK